MQMTRQMCSQREVTRRSKPDGYAGPFGCGEAISLDLYNQKYCPQSRVPFFPAEPLNTHSQKPTKIGSLARQVATHRAVT